MSPGSQEVSNIRYIFFLSDCQMLSGPTNGSVSYGNTTYLSVATYTCDTGFTLNGTENRTCQADGAWSDLSPTCQIKGCTCYVLPLNNS